MSYLRYNHEKNSMQVCLGSANKSDKITIKEQHESFLEYSLEGAFNGVEIPDFLSKHEKDGVLGELRFRELLDDNNIPCLYIGQGPFGIERSPVLLDKLDSKRADFLVTIKDMGTLLFDVKCRSRIGFHNSDETYFNLFTQEIKLLSNLKDSLSMPVWLAFTDRERIHIDKKPTFYFISIATIVEYWGGLYDFFDVQHEYEHTKVLRIPNSLFTKITDTIIFEVGHLKIEEELLNNFAKKCIGFNRIVRDKIKEVIRTKQCYKSHMHKELKQLGVNYCYPYEVTSFVDTMISQRIIEFKSHQYLKLVGE